MALVSLDLTSIARGKPRIPEPISDALTALQNAVNSIDNTQIAAAAGIEISKIATGIALTDTVNSGWISPGDTWAYASATTITVPTGAANKYSVGDKIKLTQTTIKYFYIVGVADTVLTITGGSTYTLANAAITSPYYSKVETPLGFPHWFAFAEQISGGAGSIGTFQTSDLTFRFSMKGRTCRFIARAKITNKGSWANEFRIVPPVTPVNSSNENALAGYIAATGASPSTASRGYPIISNSYIYYSKTQGTAYVEWSDIAANDVFNIRGEYEI